jgi:N-acyl amino acid synthase of PEP-CTERM/exosortase system
MTLLTSPRGQISGGAAGISTKPVIKAPREVAGKLLYAKTAMLTGIQRLRYDVYCLERQFLDAQTFSDKREYDAYDDSAVHCVAMDAEGEILGALRLVLDSSLGFPVEAHAVGLQDALHGIPRARTAEISRLVVARQPRPLRRRRADGSYPLVLLELFRQMNLESARLGLEYWLAAMEPTLHRMLRRVLGFEFVQIGGPMDYYGEVFPYLACIADVASALERDRPDLFDFFGFPAFGFGTADSSTLVPLPV